MAFNLPAETAGDGAKPFDARPFPFMEAVGDEQSSLRGEKRVAGLQKFRQLHGRVEETSACKTIADNDIVQRTIAIGFRETIGERDGKCLRIATEKLFADGIMRQPTMLCHPDFQMFRRDADNRSAELRKFICAQTNAATEIEQTDRPALPCFFDKIANLLQLFWIAVVRRAETRWIGNGAE